MKIVLLVVFAALITLSTDAFASNWKTLTPNTEIDTTTITYLKSGKVKFWVKGVTMSEESFEQQFNKKGYSYSLLQIEMDCPNRTSTLLYMSDYSDTDQMLLSTPVKEDFTPIIPGSIAKIEYNFVCKKRK
jgi:hypothetical protein